MSKFIKEETNKVKKNQKTLLQQNDKINHIIQSCDPKDMLCVYDTFLKSLETDIKPINNILPQVPTFVLGGHIKVSISAWQLGESYSSELPDKA